ncbi:hypothetical protein O6H91_Y316700 [Diphasiastrum complanatum]|nr:hypothetical protein O6H91_Y316700 [Diphasiastrum complanatum]
MVLPWVAFWRAISQLHEDGEHAILENRGKILFAASKIKSRRMHVLFALLLAWCVTVLLISVRGGVPSLPRYETVEQVFPVRLLMGWEQASFESYPILGKSDHSRITRAIKEEAHFEDDSTISVPGNTAAISNTLITTSTISEDASDRSVDIDHNSFVSVDTSNDRENNVVRTQTIQDQSGENLFRESRDEKFLIERNGRTITDISATVESASDGVDDNAQRDREENSEQEETNTEKIMNQNPTASDVEGEISQAENSVRIRNQEITCDRTHWRTDVCVVEGDVRVKAKSVELHTLGWSKKNVVETVKPYTRKWEMPLMGYIDEVRIESVDASSLQSNRTSMVCDVKHSVPAIIFSTGGYTGNVYHDFNDGLIPLYITSRHLHGEVVFLILDFHEWWLSRYGGVVRQLSHYPVVDLRNDHDTVRCFPEATVGLKIHDELAVNADQMPTGGSIKDFHRILQHAFTPDDESSSQVSAHEKKPKLVLIARRGSRSISNQDAVVNLVKRVGFEVDILEPNGGTKLEDIFTLLNSCDAMMGVHGAAMTHLLFMRPGTIFIQIIPLGTDGPALSFYGQPAMKLGLNYVEYKIKPQESSLRKQFKKNDKVLTNPEAIASKGWLELKRYYLDGQNVTPYLPRLKVTLQKALNRIKRRQSRS